MLDWLLSGMGEIIGEVLALFFGLADFVLDLIPGIDSAISSISQVVSYIGMIPAFFVYVTGINVYIWNGLIIALIVTLAWKPIIGGLKWFIDLFRSIGSVT